MQDNIKPLDTENAVKGADIKVRPKEDVTVFATAGQPFHKEGEPVVMHRVLAQKLIEHGKFTATSLKAKKGDKE
jgi:hypothetical protein